MKNFTAILLLALTSLTATAAPLQVSVEYGVYTRHLDGVHNEYGYKYNNDNDLTGIEIKKGDWSFQASTMINSFRKRGNTIGGAYYLYDGEYVQAAIEGGLVTGYDPVEMPTTCIDGACVFVAPHVSVTAISIGDFSVKPTAHLLGTALAITIKAEYTF